MDYNPIDLLYFAIQHHEFEIITDNGKIIQLKGGYSIEIEKKNLFKLSHNDKVIAPFDEVYDLCQFIIKDME